jgi:hypothetical protein
LPIRRNRFHMVYLPDDLEQQRARFTVAKLYHFDSDQDRMFRRRRQVETVSD